MSIDWNTAPEGATHWEPKSYYFTEGWMRKVGNEWSFWSEVSESWVRGTLTCNVSAEREATFEAKPQDPWNGQGLPPVGTNCEYRSNDGWLRCEVVAHRNNAAVVLNPHYEADFVPPQDLRPIRTPEQIAADSREKAIDAMLALDPPHESGFAMTSRRQFCEILFDAGYRRQEEGK
ncbi:hypothetical protein Q8W87_05415 [Pseudomonas aeruginosa]|uniref:hypothetical protein n=1 Tax=Pseudomonas aeruginosa TaxID=287 RepID=UPI002902E1A6|nr:hypothetical protein [Pseudomonas aeruginosa]MDU0699518.1 hypothetical protein [Pseudomonas aeruginosa]